MKKKLKHTLKNFDQDFKKRLEPPSIPVKRYKKFKIHAASLRVIHINITRVLSKPGTSQKPKI